MSAAGGKQQPRGVRCALRSANASAIQAARVFHGVKNVPLCSEADPTSHVAFAPICQKTQTRFQCSISSHKGTKLSESLSARLARTVIVVAGSDARASVAERSVTLPPVRGGAACYPYRPLFLSREALRRRRDTQARNPYPQANPLSSTKSKNDNVKGSEKSIRSDKSDSSSIERSLVACRHLTQ